MLIGARSAGAKAAVPMHLYLESLCISYMIHAAFLLPRNLLQSITTLNKC